MIALGTLIWVSVKPLIRLIITVLSGVVITKLDIFPLIAARGAGQVMLNIAYPALMFSKIVPAFNSSNISDLGPLVLVAIIYQTMGMMFAWIIKLLFWTPHRFRHGLLMAGGWGNTGDIPTAVVMAVTGSAPFNGASDQNLSVAFISAFIFVGFATLFPCGGYLLVAKDFVGPEVENSEVRKAARQRRQVFFIKIATFLKGKASMTPHFDEKDHDAEKDEKQAGSIASGVGSASPIPSQICQRDASKEVSFDIEEIMSHTAVPTSGICTPAPTGPEAHTTSSSSSAPRPTYKTLILSRSRMFITGLLSPCSISIIVSFVISVIPPVKALFVADVPGVHIPNAPDGEPPLQFIMDTATFIGGAAVPLGLISLGSALARLKVPWNRPGDLPLASITSLALAKMVFMPVFGVLITQGLIRGGIIDSDNKVLIFVCIFYSCLPTGTTQVMLTQVYSGTGEAEHLPAYLIPQYIIMIFSMTILTAFSLHLIFGS